MAEVESPRSPRIRSFEIPARKARVAAVLRSACGVMPSARLAFAPVARPDILIDRSEEAGRLAQPGAWPEVCEPIFSREIGDLGIARPGRYVYTVYRMRWENYRPDDAR